MICFDVLEHIPDPPKLVAQLTSYLRPGGRLIAHAPFWYLNPAVVTHLAVNRKYSGDLSRLYRPFGLRPIDGQVFWTPIVLEKMTAGTRYTQVPLSRRLKLLIGGLLLSVGRFWSGPHVWFFQVLWKMSQIAVVIFGILVAMTVS